MAIVSVDEMYKVLGEKIADTIDEDQLLGTIDLIQGEMESYINRPIQPTTYTAEQHIINLLEPTLFLRHTPVISVASVTSDDLAGGVVPPGLYTVASWGLDFAGFNTLVLSDPVIWTPSQSHFTWQQTPDVLILATGAYPQSSWQVTYTAGLDGATIPGLKSVLIRAVRREIASLKEGWASFYTRLRVEDAMFQKNERLILAMSGAFTPGETRIMDVYRHKAIS